MVLGGDLRQTLPVIEGDSRSEIINSAIVNSSLWTHINILHLTTNMRLSSNALTLVNGC
jgi:ATP-dependent DNA helicase PIF1